MDIQKNREKQMYGLKPVNGSTKAQTGVFSKGRFLLGRTESCDFIIDHDSISAVHAVLEIFDDRAIIYDMNSTNGTFVNGEKIVKKEIQLDEVFSMAKFEIKFTKYVFEQSLPPVLDSLEPEKGSASVKLPELPKSLPNVAPPISDGMPSIVYPLASDPKADFSEYIFEDKDDLYPIFKYEASRQAVEVIILFKDSIFSVDYLPEGKATYFITGVQSKSHEFEFPYLGKAEKFPFVDVKKDSTQVHTLPGFGVFHLSDDKKDTGHQGASIELRGQDLVRLQKDDLQIFVRNVASPPKILHAPILKRDPEFRKMLLMCLSFAFFISLGINLISFVMPEEKKEEEPEPERLATILYKKPVRKSAVKKLITKVKEKPKPVKKIAPPKVVSTPKAKPKVEPPVKKPDVIKTADQTKKPDPGKKSAPVKKVVKQGTKPVTKPSNKVASSPPAKAITTTTKTTGSSVPKTSKATSNSKAIGKVDVYKSADFKSSVSSMVAKGGSLSGVETKSSSDGASGLSGSISGVSTGSGSVKTANFQTNQGSLVGAATGVLSDSKGAEGLSAKRTIITAGMPSETVVLGSMDPDIIRRILLEHLAQFRYCYQKELDKTGKEDMSGIITLDFTIGASGHVANAGVESGSRIPSPVKKCVINVLKGITFPEPLGGGVIGVKQPINFFPRKL